MKIDWKNHFIAFLSAFLGILIAFYLEDLREDRQDNEKLETAYKLVLIEIENNIGIYQKNTKLIGSFVKYYENIYDLAFGKVDVINMRLPEYMEIIMDSTLTYRLANYNVTIKDSSVSIRRSGPIDNDGNYDLNFDILPKTGIATSAWSSSLSSGIFTQLQPQKLSKMTELYDWINNDLGRNEYGIYEYGIAIDRQFDIIDQIIYYYKVLLEVQGMKLKHIKPLYNQIKEIDKIEK